MATTDKTALLTEEANVTYPEQTERSKRIKFCIYISIGLIVIAAVILILYAADVFDDDEGGSTSEGPVTEEDVEDLRVFMYDLFNESTIDETNIRPLIGTVVRLAFHDCGGPADPLLFNDSDLMTAICDGCIDPTNLPNHAGLWEAVAPLEMLYEDGNYSQIMSRADFWATAALFALEMASENQIPNLGFYFGRKDCLLSPVTDEGDMMFPDPEAGWDETEEWFNYHFDLSLREAVALIGAHTLGRAHAEASGYINPWVDEPETLDNAFFVDLIAQSEGWNQQIVNETGRIQWVDFEGEFLMFNVDMALYIRIEEYLNLTDGGSVSCNFIETIEPVCPRQNATASIVEEFADDNQKWLDEFADVFQKMILTGYDYENDEDFYFVKSKA